MGSTLAGSWSAVDGDIPIAFEMAIDTRAVWPWVLELDPSTAAMSAARINVPPDVLKVTGTLKGMVATPPKNWPTLVVPQGRDPISVSPESSLPLLLVSK